MVLKFCVAIPVYNNPETIEQVVKDCLASTTYDILILDDGSLRPVAEIVSPHPRVQVLRSSENRGKGDAIQRGFAWAARKGYTHLITMDGDGQHHAAAISSLVQKAQAAPWSLIIGARKLGGENVPEISRFGRRFSNFWVKYETGKGIADSQSGFRLYPIFQVQCLTLRRKRYDFEIEVLIRLMWKGVDVEEVEIDVHYPPPEKRISHFRKFRDNARISWLNTQLVAVSLLRRHRSTAQIAMAVGLGVLIGTTPFFGFHAPIAIALALLFRLNVIAIFLGTQISIPPLAPLLAFSSIKLGSFILGSKPPETFEFQTAKLFFIDWLVGSLFLGTALGVLAGSGTYLIHRRLVRQSKPNWTGKNRGGRFGNWFMASAVRRGGLPLAYFFLRFLIPYFYLFAPKGRRALNQYWSIVDPEGGAVSRVRHTFSHFYRFGQILLDRVYQSHLDRQFFSLRQDGTRHIVDIANSGQGAIIVGAHCGGWDIAARYLEWHGLKRGFAPVQLEAEGPTSEKNLSDQEKTAVDKVITNQTQLPIFDIRERLDLGNPIGFMADRPDFRRVELVPFFGKLAAFDPTPFRVAAITGKPVIMSLGFKSDGNYYDFYATEPRVRKFVAGSPKEDQIREWIAEFADYLESYVRKYPTQWFNFYDFWSSPPGYLDASGLAQ